MRPGSAAPSRTARRRSTRRPASAAAPTGRTAHPEAPDTPPGSPPNAIRGRRRIRSEPGRGTRRPPLLLVHVVRPGADLHLDLLGVLAALHGHCDLGPGLGRPHLLDEILDREHRLTVVLLDH